MTENEGKMQGWLYLIRYNRIGLQYSRKRYFILEGNCLKSFKSIPTSHTEVRVSILKHAHICVNYECVMCSSVCGVFFIFLV